MRKQLSAFAFVLTCLALGGGKVYAQGSLTPPGGPGQTMKTLNQIEPRTPLAGPLPLVINTPGSYYLTTNLQTAIGQNGITISNNNVTLDLGGFSLTGAGGSGFGTGIRLEGGVTNVTIRNGTITAWPDNGIFGSGLSVNVLVENVNFTGNAGNGMAMLNGAGHTIRNCHVQGNGGNGLWVNNALVTGCTFRGNKSSGLEGAGLMVQNCLVISNANIGLSLSGANSFAQNCQVLSNGNYGIYLSGGGLVENCQVAYTMTNVGVGIGIYAVGSAQILNCQTRLNADTGIHVEGGRVLNCQSVVNGGRGIVANNSAVSGCNVQSNVLSGIYVNRPGSVITDNLCRFNNSAVGATHAGIYLNDSYCRVENNHVIGGGAAAGIQVNASYVANVVVRNTVAGFGANNYVGTANNDFGPVVTSVTAATNAWSNISH